MKWLPAMTESKDAILARFPENPLEVAVQAAMAKPGAVDEMKAFYRALYDAEVIIPLAADGPDVEVPQPSQDETSIGFLSVTLEGVEHAVMFSSVSQMHLAFPNGCSYSRIKMSRLCGVWPDAPAALNPPGLAVRCRPMRSAASPLARWPPAPRWPRSRCGRPRRVWTRFLRSCFGRRRTRWYSAPSASISSKLQRWS